MSRTNLPATRVASLAMLLAAALAGGCAMESTKRSEEIVKLTSVQTEVMRGCIEGVYASADFEAARRRLPSDVAQATLEQETDPSIARDPEIAAVLKVHPKLQVCRKTFLDGLTQSQPTLVPIYALVFNVTENSLLEVMQKKRTWGDHVRDAKLLETKANAEVVEETKKIGSGLSQDPKAVQTRKEAADKAVGLYEQTEKTFATLRRPIITKTN